MHRVSGLDLSMLYAETREMPMHTMGVLILARKPHSIFDRYQRLLAERLHLLPVLRRRLVEDPLGVNDAYWIEDPDFALKNHLIRAAVRAPHTLLEVAEYAGDLAGRLLDRTRPLWEIHVLDGLAGGATAMLVKVHHATMDGSKLIEMMRVLLDPSARVRRVPAPGEPWVPEQEPSTLWLAADRMLTLAAKPLRATRSLVEIGATLLRDALAHRDTSAAAPEDREGLAKIFEAPPTPFNGALSPARVVGMADVSFATVKLISEHYGVTLNDVVLAAACGALRNWLETHGGLPERPLVANVPVAVRTGSDAEAGNRISMILIHLPVQTLDPVQRLRAIAAETARAKALQGVGKSKSKSAGTVSGKGKRDMLRQAAELLTSIGTPWSWSHIMSGYAHGSLAARIPRFWNLVVSNLPGPRGPLYCAGARVLRIYPFGPIQLGNGLNLTVLSSGNRLCLGTLACKRMVPDVQTIATDFAKEIALLKRRWR